MPSTRPREFRISRFSRVLSFELLPTLPVPLPQSCHFERGRRPSREICGADGQRFPLRFTDVSTRSLRSLGRDDMEETGRAREDRKPPQEIPGAGGNPPSGAECDRGRGSPANDHPLVTVRRDGRRPSAIPNSEFRIPNSFYRRPLRRLRSRRETSTLFIANATGEATKMDE